ncbi:hypothetical protein [Treponema pectinovorum]|uniref:hypothetical protein n=1 Tax=Treponema pectinovorum TaxID=164 RepID=UPI0011C926CC|nr:hypothetical protein [Treponema pectinovorum]
MTCSERTTIFNIAVGLYNIILGLLIEFLLVGTSFLLLSSFPAMANSIPVNVALPFILFAGIIIAMILSMKTITWAIKKFNLKDKVDYKAIKRYLKDEI